MIKIKIPATTTNIGSGLENLGIALNLYNYVELEEYEGYEKTVQDENSLSSTEEDIIFYSATRLFQECGRTVHGFKIHCENNIPFAKGLGAKASCIAGGLVGANRLLGDPMTKDELINLGYSIAGSSNNIASAITGGLTVSAIDEKQVKYTKSDLPDNLTFVAFIPPYEQKSDNFDYTLLNTVSVSDAIFNLSRSSLMATSLIMGKYENLFCASKDKIYQKKIMEQIPGAEKLMNRVLGYDAIMSFISGAGPTIVALYKGKKEIIDYSASVLIEDREFSGWEYKILSCDNNGAVII